MDYYISSSLLKIKNKKESIRIPEVGIYNLPIVTENRGKIAIAEFENQIPFVAKRYFIVHDVPQSETRGSHAHKLCQQFITCTHGSVLLRVNNSEIEEEIFLNSLAIGVHLPPMIWLSLHQFSNDAVVLVFASEHYDENDYINNYSSYKKYKADLR